MEKSEVYFGSRIEHSTSHELKAGPLSLIYDNGYIRDLSIANKVVLKRIYVAVRDQFWNTIEFDISDFVIHKNEASFEISFQCRHRRNDVDFSWKGAIKGDTNGKVSFTMDGKALTTFQTWRIGFCILHPLESKGEPLTVIHDDGNKTSSTFPTDIKPHQPFLNIQALITHPLPGVTFSVKTQGSVFEMEDQRNWTDASFKTYCPPIEQPGLHFIEAGTSIQQTITMDVDSLESIPASPQINPELDLDALGSPRPLPRLGCCLDQNENWEVSSMRYLKMLNLSHVRMDIDVEAPDMPRQIRRAAAACAHLDLPAEIALHFGDDYESQTASLLSALQSVQLPVKWYLVFSNKSRVTPAALVTEVKEALKTYSHDALIGGGTDSYYVELNRSHPPIGALDLLSFSANPQVHTFDNAAVMDNAQGIMEVLHDITRFSGNLPIAVSPITLRPRTRADLPEKDGGADMRLWGLFGGAWTLKHFTSSIKENVSSLTYFSAFGKSGVIGLGDETTSPAYHVLSFINDFNGGECRFVQGTDQDIPGILLSKDNQHRFLAANCTESEQKVKIQSLPNAEVSYSLLDEDSFSEAVFSPESYFCKDCFTTEKTPVFSISLKPYAVLRMDWSSKGLDTPTPCIV